MYVVIEKILAPGQELLARWQVDGTTGYEFMNAVTGLAVDGRNARAFDAVYRRFTRDAAPFAETAYAAKKFVLETALSAELNVLALRLDRIAQRDPRTRDFTLGALRRVLVETIAAFPIYRTYVTGAAVEPADRLFIERATAIARARDATDEGSTYEFLRRVLLAQHPDDAVRERYVEFAMRFQQLTAPVTAKGVEDTAFYRSVRLAALNEVGGDPAHFGTSVADFHRQNARRAANHPHAMLATATHDNKRGEDVRARIAAISEVPAEWRRALARWTRLNRKHRGAVTRLAEYVLYQTILGAWPTELLAGDVDAAALAAFAERIVGVHRSKRRARRSCARAGRTPTPRTNARSRTSCARSSTRSARRSSSKACATARAASPRPRSPTAWRRSCSKRRSRACRTRTRARSCGTSAWSIPTTAGRWTSPRAAPRCARSTTRSTAARRAKRSRASCSRRGRTGASSCTCSRRCCATAPRAAAGRDDAYAPLDALGERCRARRRVRARQRDRRRAAPAAHAFGRTSAARRSGVGHDRARARRRTARARYRDVLTGRVVAAVDARRPPRAAAGGCARRAAGRRARSGRRTRALTAREQLRLDRLELGFGEAAARAHAVEIGQQPHRVGGVGRARASPSPPNDTVDVVIVRLPSALTTAVSPAARPAWRSASSTAACTCGADDAADAVTDVPPARCARRSRRRRRSARRARA